MEKGLKVLNDIRELVNRVEYASKIPNINNELDTIEKELKALDILKNLFMVSCDEEAKVLIIYAKIDDKNLRVIYVTHNEEEYDLLKEVLYGTD